MALRALLRTVGMALSGSPSLVPDFVLERIEDLDPHELSRLGVHHVLFDFDNTLAHWAAKRIPEGARRVIDRLLEAGIDVAVASNGSSWRFGRLARTWQGRVSFLGGCRKPDGARINAYLAEAGWDPRATLFVGDNTLTDVAAGRTVGCLTALVRPLSFWEAPPTKIWRLLELVHRRLAPGWRHVSRLGAAPFS